MLSRFTIPIILKKSNTAYEKGYNWTRCMLALQHPLIMQLSSHDLSTCSGRTLPSLRSFQKMTKVTSSCDNTLLPGPLKESANFHLPFLEALIRAIMSLFSIFHFTPLTKKKKKIHGNWICDFLPTTPTGPGHTPKFWYQTHFGQSHTMPFP